MKITTNTFFNPPSDDAFFDNFEFYMYRLGASEEKQFNLIHNYDKYNLNERYENNQLFVKINEKTDAKDFHCIVLFDLKNIKLNIINSMMNNGLFQQDIINNKFNNWKEIYSQFKLSFIFVPKDKDMDLECLKKRLINTIDDYACILIKKLKNYETKIANEDIEVTAHPAIFEIMFQTMYHEFCHIAKPDSMKKEEIKAIYRALIYLYDISNKMNENALDISISENFINRGVN